MTKTWVEQQCLAANLAAASRPGAAAPEACSSADPRATTCRAFADAGLIGTVAAGSAPAHKAAVRTRVLGRHAKGGCAA